MLPLPATSTPSCARVSPPTSGENYAGHDGMWVGGWLDLMPHAETMSLDGRVAGRLRSAALDDVARRRIDYLGLLPNLLVSLHPDYVMTHRLEPLAPDRTVDRVPVAVRPRGRRRGRLRPVVRGRLLGPHQPPGLGGLRGRCSAASASRGYRPGPVRRRRGRRRRVRPPRRPAYVTGGWTR